MRQLSLELPIAPDVSRDAAAASVLDPVGVAAGVARSRGGSAAFALTAEQELAVCRRQGSMLLAAAAGSGKTSVLVERYVRAVAEDDLPPARILAITFTERAAWELKERVRARLQDLGLRALARDTEAASVGTIHAFCAKLLRADPLAAGLPPGFRILEETTAARLREMAFVDALDEGIAQASPVELDLAAAYGPDRLRRIVIATHGRLRSRGHLRPTLPAVPAAAAPDALAAHSLISALLRRFGEAYERRKRDCEAVDFDDLELAALQVLESDPETASRWAERFDLLMVDEFQDVNPRQLALLKALERENLFTVGDEWQSIYGFRHADVEVFRQRSAELSRRGARLALTRNFRSRPEVIEAVNAAFGQRFGERFQPLVATRERAGGSDPSVEVLLTGMQGWEQDHVLAQRISAGLPGAPIWRHAEARLLARRLAQLVQQRRVQPAEIAVLLRSMSDVSVYECALRAQGLPTFAATADLWQTAAAQDTLAALHALANPRDELALYGVLSGRSAGLSADALGLLALSARAGGRRGLWDAICERAQTPGGQNGLAAGDEARLARFHADFLEQRRELAERSLAELVHVAADLAVEQAEVHRGETESTGAHAAVRVLARVAADFEALEGRDLRRLLDHLRQLERAGAPLAAERSSSPTDAVGLMSIHAAKGLEFPVVCVADLGRAQGGRDVPDLLLDAGRVGLRVPRLDGGPAELAFDYERLGEERLRAAEQEEDRILYVAMTRAKEMLLVSGAIDFERWPRQGQGRQPIAWLAPALVADLSERIASTACEAPSVVARPASANLPALGCVLSTPASTGASLVEGERPSSAGAPAAVGPAPPVPGAPSRVGPAPPAPDAPSGLVPAPPVPESSRMPGLDASTLSYTALTQLERCGYRYYLERVIGLPELTDVSPDALSATSGGAQDMARTIGEVAHRLLQSFDFRRCSDPGVEQVHSAAAQAGVQLDAAAASEIVEMLKGLATTPLARRLARCRELHAEHPFRFALRPSGPKIGGTFDALASERGGRRLVVDYKTGAVAVDDDLEALVLRDYELQRLIYALAALRGGAAEVEVAHWFLHRPLQPIAARFHASQLPQLEAQVLTRAKAAMERGFVVSSDPHRALCMTCPGRTGLCSWPQEVTMRERGPQEVTMCERGVGAGAAGG